MPERVCPECGLVEVATGVTKCATCGVGLLDPFDPEARVEIDEVARLKADLARPRWTVIVPALLFVPIYVYAIERTGDRNAATLIGYGSLIAMIAAGLWWTRRRMEPGWRDLAAARDRFHPEEAALSRRSRRSTTTVVAIACVVVAIVVVPAVGVERLAYVPGHTRDAPWTLLTSALTHAGPAHLAGNLLGLVIYGGAVDLRIGRAATAVVIVAAALGGAAMQAAFSPAPMVGLSAVVYGLIGASLALMPGRRTLLGSIPLPTWAAMMIWMPLVTFADYAGQHRIAWAAHLGGFATGFVLGLVLRGTRPDPLFAMSEARHAERMDKIAERSR